jgi:hypothetical protein
MKDLIEAFADLFEGAAKLGPIGLFAVCLVLTFVSWSVFPSIAWFFVLATIGSGIFLAVWAYNQFK